MLAIATTVLASLGRERLSAWITLGALVLVMGGCAVLVSKASFGAPELRAAAVATSTALLAALIAAGFAVRTLAGGFLRGLSVLRVLATVIVLGAFGRYLPSHGGRTLTVALAVAVSAAFVAVLTVTRELTGADTEALLKMRRRS